MTKFRLDVEYDYDFHLIGISCHERDYRLCRALNIGLDIALEKVHRDHASEGLKKNGVAIESLYAYYDEQNHANYRLLYNKHNHNLLLPEQKMADFLLIIEEFPESKLEELMQKLKRIDLIIASFVIDVSGLKSKENLIF